MNKKKIFIVVATMAFIVSGCSNPPESGSLKAQTQDTQYSIQDTRQESRIENQESRNISLGENPTLYDYLRYAALNNAGLKAAFEQWRMAVDQVPQAQSLPDPNSRMVILSRKSKRESDRKKTSWISCKHFPGSAR